MPQKKSELQLDSFENIQKAITGCKLCKLCLKRTNTVPGEGNPEAPILFVGEGPGEEEDKQGRPFVGRAGQLLDKELAAIGLSRENSYIANVVKCRPPMNRNPEPDEVISCMRYLRAQYTLIKPKIVVCLGAVASKWLISNEVHITTDHGKWYDKNGVWFMPTYHPSALLRDESKKRPAWEDLKKIRMKLEEIQKNTDAGEKEPAGKGD